MVDDFLYGMYYGYDVFDTHANKRVKVFPVLAGWVNDTRAIPQFIGNRGIGSVKSGCVKCQQQGTSWHAEEMVSNHKMNANEC